MRLFKNNSFAHKITLTSLFATCIAVGTLTTAFLVMDSISSRSSLNARLSTLADVVGKNSTAALNFRDRAAAIEVVEALRAEPSLITACLYDSSGALFAQYQRYSKTRTCPKNRNEVLPSSRAFPSVIRSVLHRDDFLGSVVLTSDVEELKRRRKQLLLLAGILLVLALSIAGVSGVLLQRKILKPISDLSLAIQKVRAEQTYSAQVSISGSDEIAHLGSGFNAMLCELERRETEKKEVEALLELQANNDALTGLPNRRLFGERLALTLATAERGLLTVAMLYIDLDGFKLVNDSLGHGIGDLLLIHVAARFSARIRKSDTLARIGGDEFTVILSSLHDKEEAMMVGRTLLDTLSQPFDIEGHLLNIGASIGISIYPENAQNGSELMQQADGAMYAAKRSGKNQAMYYTPDLGILVCERMNLENQLRNALAQGQIYVNYQPEFDVLSGRLVRFEALARWNHPTLGTIPPGKFIPVAEESGLIVPLGAFVLEQACIEARKWQAIAAYPIQVAVNVSSIQFGRITFTEEVAEILNRTGLRPDLLQIELTESVMIDGIASTAKMMARLKSLGVTFAIDDFGTGYSCLSYLPSLPFDALKIDRSFVKTCNSNHEGRMLVQSLITLAQNIGLRVIVEGVETAEQLAVIKDLGGNEAQGYLLGHPNSNPISTILSFCDRGKQAAAEPVRQPEERQRLGVEAMETVRI
jgi:diguanylate cyclase (GGDEF)-like protein